LPGNATVPRILKIESKTKLKILHV